MGLGFGLGMKFELGHNNRLLLHQSAVAIADYADSYCCGFL